MNVAPPRPPTARLALSLLLGGALLPSALRPATLTWDADPAAASAQDGTGIWTTAGTNWRNGTTNVSWNNATPDSALFGVNSGAAGTVTLAAAITADDLTFNAPGSGNYTLSGGGFTLTLSSTATAVVLNSAATLALAPAAASSFRQLVNNSAGKVVLGGTIRNLQQSGTWNGITPLNGTVQVVGGTWNAGAIERTTELSVSPWPTTVLDNIAATGGTVTVTDANAASLPRVFYRVKIKL